jgi:hypothetical protein
MLVTVTIERPANWPIGRCKFLIAATENQPTVGNQQNDVMWQTDAA